MLLARHLKEKRVSPKRFSELNIGEFFDLWGERNPQEALFVKIDNNSALILFDIIGGRALQIFFDPNEEVFSFPDGESIKRSLENNFAIVTI